MTTIRFVLAAVLLGAVMDGPASAQDPAADPGNDHILVLGMLNADDLPVQGKSVQAFFSRESRRIGTEVDRFMRCTELPEPKTARAILDNPPTSSAAQHALHRFVVRNRGCYGGAPNPLPASPFYGDCNVQISGAGAEIKVCRALYDRGALFERAVKAYGEDVTLTRAQTFDRDVRARFLNRKHDHDRMRVPMDQRYLGIVSCFVQISPEQGHLLLEAEGGSEEETAARRLLIGLGAPCVDHVPEVSVDPHQFRAYAAEAMYNWLVAAANKATLVPE